MSYGTNAKFMIDALGKIDPPLSNFLHGYLNSSMQEYIHVIWQTYTNPRSHHSTLARSILAEELEQAVSSERLSNVNLLEFLNSYPVIQTGSHCQLLLSPLNFYTNLATFIGAKSLKAKVSLNNMCSTIGLQGANYTGPGWLLYRGKNIKLFEYPGAKMDTTFVGSEMTDRFWDFRKLKHTDVDAV